MVWNIKDSGVFEEDKWHQYVVPHSSPVNITGVSAVKRLGDRVVSAGEDGVVKIWTLLKDSMTLRLDNSFHFRSAVIALSIRTEDEIAVSTWSAIPKTDEYTASIVYNISKNATIRESFFSDTPFYALDFSPDGDYLATGAGPVSSFGFVSIFELNSTSMNPVKDRFQQSDCIKTVQWSADQKFLLSGSRYDEVIIWKTFAIFPDNMKVVEFDDFEVSDAVISARYFTNNSIVAPDISPTTRLYSPRKMENFIGQTFMMRGGDW